MHKRESTRIHCFWQMTVHPKMGHESLEVWNHALHNPWRNLHTSHTVPSTWIPTCPSAAGINWGPALQPVNHHDTETSLGCRMHPALPWSWSRKSGQNPCELASHRQTWTHVEIPPFPHGWWLPQSNCWQWPHFVPVLNHATKSKTLILCVSKWRELGLAHGSISSVMI